MKKKDFALGILCGAMLFSGATAVAAGITAEPTWQNIYVDGKQVSMTAYNISGNNYVKLRDIGQQSDSMCIGRTVSRLKRMLHTPALLLYGKRNNCQLSKKSGRR